MTEKEMLEMLHAELAKVLLARITDPEAKSSDLNVARQFLKDNHIEGKAVQDSPLGQLANSLPDFSDEDSDITEMYRH